MEPPCRCPIIVCNNSLFKKMWVWMKSSGLSLVLAVLSSAAPYCAIVQPVIMSSSGATVGKQMGHQVMGEIYLGSYSCCMLLSLHIEQMIVVNRQTAQSKLQSRSAGRPMVTNTHARCDCSSPVSVSQYKYDSTDQI